MSLWTEFRDAVESVAVVVGNYYLPGSSILTSKLVSEGSQEQLSSDLGILAQLTSGGFGAAQGNLSNYGKVFGYESAGASGSPGTGLATDTQSTGLLGAKDTSSLSGMKQLPASGGGQYSLTSAVPNTTNTAASALSNTPTSTPGMWDKIGAFLDKPGAVAGVGLGVQGVGAIMGGMGAAEQAKVAKEKQDYERAQQERQLANINMPSYNPVRVRPQGLLSMNQPLTSRSVLT